MFCMIKGFHIIFVDQSKYSNTGYHAGMEGSFRDVVTGAVTADMLLTSTSSIMILIGAC